MSKIIVKDLAGPASSSNKIYIASGSELDIAGSSGTINLAVDAADITSGTLSDGRFASDSILFVQESVIAADASIQQDPGGTAVAATGVEITVPAASVNRCSKLIVKMAAGFRVNKDTHAFCEVNVVRTAPSTATGGLVYAGVVSGGTEIYDPVTTMYVDESLSNADHTYKMYINDGAASYAANIYPRKGQCVITVMGVK
jgi:hypothetical protein